MYKMIQKKTEEEKLVEAYIPKDSGIVANFLCSKPHKIRSLGKSYPGYKSALFFKAVNEVVKDYDVRAIFDLKYGRWQVLVIHIWKLAEEKEKNSLLLE